MIEQLLEQAVHQGFITCQNCDNRIEPDADACYCGWQNPLVREGWI